IEGAIGQITQIADELIRIDPAYAGQYENNATRYITALRELEEETTGFMQSDGVKKAVSVHDAFHYLTEDFGIEVIETITEGSYENASAKQIQSLIEHMKSEKVSVILTEQKNKDLAILNTIQNEVDCKVYVLDALVTGDERMAYEDSLNCEEMTYEYVVRMEENMRILREVFARKV
ncbi:MAG: metal ABC transporter substrate-binding protein, partial [Niameybacter sp.]